MCKEAIHLSYPKLLAVHSNVWLTGCLFKKTFYHNQLGGEKPQVKFIMMSGYSKPSQSKLLHMSRKRVSSVQSLSRVLLFATPWTTARQASLSITNSQSLLKFMSIESVMPSNYLILCRPLLLLPSIFPSISVFSNESALRIRWPKYWSFSFNKKWTPRTDLL